MLSDTQRYVLNPDYEFLARPKTKDVVAIVKSDLFQLKGTMAESIRRHAINGVQIPALSQAPENALEMAEKTLVCRGFMVESSSELLDFVDCQCDPSILVSGSFRFVDFVGVTQLKEFVSIIDNWATNESIVRSDKFSIIISRSLTDSRVKRQVEKLLQSGSKVSFFIIEPNRFIVGPVFPSHEITPEDLFQCVNYNEKSEQLDAEELMTSLKRRTIHEGLLGGLKNIADFLQDPEGCQLRNSLVNTYGSNQRHYVRRARIQPGPVPTAAMPLVLTEGTHGERQYTSEQFVEKYSFLVSDVTGVVTSLNRVETKEKSEPSFVYTAGHNWALRTDNPESIRRSLRGQSGGKGMTEIDAMAGAIAEAVERHSTIARGNEPVVRCKFKDLANAIHPNDIALFSQRQFNNREELNSLPSLYHHVPEMFNQDSLCSFVPIWSPSKDTTAWMLESQAYYMFPNAAALPGAIDPNGMKYARADSNGCAAGTTLADAAFQGICELIERDAVSIWWHNRIKRPEISISSLNNTYITNVAQWMKKHGRDLWLLDLTNDIGIPVVAAVSATSKIEGTNKILLGFGSHVDVSRAATRAISEVIQFQAALPAEVTGVQLPNRLTGSEAIDWFAFQTLEANDFLLPNGHSDPSRYQKQREYDIKQLISSIEAVGTTVFLLNETRPDIGLPVVRCVAPGLRPWWRRLAPGRLYDVPVKLGWLKSARAEEEMNPIGMFF